MTTDIRALPDYRGRDFAAQRRGLHHHIYILRATAWMASRRQHLQRNSGDAPAAGSGDAQNACSVDSALRRSCGFASTNRVPWGADHGTHATHVGAGGPVRPLARPGIKSWGTKGGRVSSATAKYLLNLPISRFSGGGRVPPRLCASQESWSPRGIGKAKRVWYTAFRRGCRGCSQRFTVRVGCNVAVAEDLNATLAQT